MVIEHQVRGLIDLGLSRGRCQHPLSHALKWVHNLVYPHSLSPSLTLDQTCATEESSEPKHSRSSRTTNGTLEGRQKLGRTNLVGKDQQAGLYAAAQSGTYRQM